MNRTILNCCESVRFDPLRAVHRESGHLSLLPDNYRDTYQAEKLVINDQRTPWGGGKKRGAENLTNDTPPKKGFWTPLVRYVFHPPHVSVLCFSCTEIHDRADQKLFWRGPKIFGGARSLVRFPPPIRFAPPHITAQNDGVLKSVPFLATMACNGDDQSQEC